MKRDVTVTLSLAVFAGVAVFNAVAPRGTPVGVAVALVLVPNLLAGLRGLVLWFQTLADACAPGGGERSRVGWIVGHFLLGPLASYPYYYLHRERAEAGGRGWARDDEELKQRANAGTL